MRVQDLERLLKEHGIEAGSSGSLLEAAKDVPIPTPDRVIAPIRDRVVDQTENSEGIDDPRDLSLDHLVSLKLCWPSCVHPER